jgi:hypothetical protein
MLKATHPIMRKILDEQMPVRGVSVHLFQNNAVPSRNSSLLDFVEATFDGYTSLPPVWAPSFQNGVEDVAAAPKLTFEAGAGLSGPQDIYGYYVLDVDGDLSWAEAFDGGLTTVSVVGQQIDVFPQFKIKNYGE